MHLALTERLPLLAAFRYRNYRFYWSGMFIATMGYQMQMVTVPWLVYELTGSPLYLGMVSGAQGFATILFTLFGGVLADRVDRRRLLLLTNSLFFLLLFFLASLTTANLVTVWHLLIYAFLYGVVIAFDTPTRQALLPHLIDDRKDLMNAIALHSTIWQTGRVVGPAIAAVLLGILGMSPIFFIASGAYLVMVLAMTRVSVSHEIRSSGRGMGAALWEGVQYVRRNSVFSSVIGLVFANSIFGMSFIFLMPVFAGDVLNVEGSGYGFLMTAMGLGTLGGGFLTAALGKFRRKNLLLLGASGLYGLLLVFFSFSRLYISSVMLIFIAGFMQQIYMVTAQTVIQWLVPDEVRGRVMAIYALVWSLTPLGALQAGAVANYLGAPVAVAIGGAVVTSFTLFLIMTVPRITRLQL